MRKPDRLKYGVDDSPPLSELLVLALQHAGLAIMFMIYPVAAAQAIRLDPAQTAALVTASMIAIAVATLVQYARAPWGSGMLAVQIPTPVMLPAVVHTGLLGGPALIAGMTLVLSVSEVMLARVMRYLRAYFPPEICGVVVLMLGVSIATPALTSFTGVENAAPAPGQLIRADLHHLLVASATLAVIVATTVFGHGKIKLFALAGGMLVGVSLSLAMGVISPEDIRRVSEAPLLGLPVLNLQWPKFDMLLVPLFVLMAAVNSMDNLGVLVGIQRMVDADWKKIDMVKGAGGMQAGAVGDFVAGVMGGVPGGVSSAHVGLSFATGAAARIIAAVVAGMLLLAVFTPKVVTALAIIPRPVIGALMAYTSAYMLVSGMELIQSRMLSERRIFTVGLSVLLGLTPLILPGIYDDLPELIAPVFHSSLAIAALAALLLNVLFRIGVAQTASTAVDDSVTSYEAVRIFLEKQGGLWGARRDVMERAIGAASEALEAVRSAGVAVQNIELAARFDEVDLHVILSYQGEALEFPEQRPRVEDLFEDDRGPLRMAGYIVRRSVDKLIHRPEGEWHRLTLHFEH
jgi:xanthine permease XanP